MLRKSDLIDFVRIVQRFIENFGKLCALSRREQWTILVAAACMPAFWLGLRVLGLRRFQAWLQAPALPGNPVLPVEQLLRLGVLVNVAARHVPCPVTCLTRSLVLGWLLHRRGVATDLRIGVRLESGVLDAHAWLEYRGVPVNDRQDVGMHFAPFGDGLSVASFASS